MAIIELTGDSAEYEFLAEAVELSKDVQGMCAEIGLRRGFGTKTIIDAVRQCCPDKPVIAIDPYGNIEYEHREGQIIRLDYTNQMKNECLAALYAYLVEHPVNFQFFNTTDTDFFELFATGVMFYNLKAENINTYSMVHLDGPHGYEAVIEEIDWFDDRMLPGATLVIDDFSEDFISMQPVSEHLVSLGFKHIKTGNKKTLWQKK